MGPKGPESWVPIPENEAKNARSHIPKLSLRPKGWVQRAPKYGHDAGGQAGDDMRPSTDKIPSDQHFVEPLAAVIRCT